MCWMIDICLRDLMHVVSDFFDCIFWDSVALTPLNDQVRTGSGRKGSDHDIRIEELLS